MKGYWIRKMKKVGDTGRNYTPGYECSKCGEWTKKKTNFCACCGDPKEETEQKDAAISKQRVIREIRKMEDIDGYPDGDLISRRAVIAMIGALQDERESNEDN